MRSRLIILVIAAALASAHIAAAQGSLIDSLFAHVPTTALSLLDRTARLDMLDLYNHGMDARAENVYGGQSIMTSKTADALTLRTTDVSTWQMKLLPADGDTLIACVHTVTAGAAGSEVVLYNKAWQPTSVKAPRPKLDEFMVSPSDSISLSRIRRARTLIEGAPIEARWNSEGAPVLTYNVSLGSLGDEDRQRVASCLKQLSYGWSNGRFAPLTSHQPTTGSKTGAKSEKR